MSFADVATSRYATVLFAFLFIFAFIGLYNVQKQRYLNSLQRYGMMLLMVGMQLRIVLLLIDYTNLLVNGHHFIMKEQNGFPESYKLEVFIKTPEVLFEFPLFAISLDWLELAVLLKSTDTMSTDTYLKTHRSLQIWFFSIAGLVITVIAFDLILNIFYPHDKTTWKIFSAYTGTIDCIQSLITASFSTLVLTLFIGAYVSLVRSIKKL